MLKGISRFFQERLRPDETGPGGHLPETRLRLATAALLIEMTRADFTVTDDERATVLGMLQEHFGLGDAETCELVELAELEVRTSSSLFQFTHLIDRHFTLEQKIAIVELLWKVAYADAARHHQEEHLVRKVADLLHVPHSAFVRMRERAETAVKR
jgi:uncharacterized tellurite resistance protein B-like protein